MRGALKQTVIVLVAGLALGGVPSMMLAQADAVKLQGSGSRRDALDALSFKPLDIALLGRLEAWNGRAIDAEALKGKPALIVVWASWFTGSLPGLTLAQQQADANPDLVVMGIHHQRGFEKAGETAQRLKIKAPYAHDASGGVLKALRADSAGPVFYVVDRAGRVRFADVERSSLEAAVKLVVAETESDAAKVQPPAPPSATKPAAGGADAMPAAGAYASVKWPAANDDPGATNLQGKSLPVAFGQNETWITPKVDLAGKVMVLDFWATWCGPCIRASPILDELQQKHEGKLAVIAVGGQKRSNFPEDVNAIKKFLVKKPSKYSHVHDKDQTVYKSVKPRGIPHVVVLSTDGVVRWQGNPLDPSFRVIVDAVVGVDPGARAAKAAGAAPRP